eukprot:9080738-Pyramimonas_sp.AAC.1
MGGRAAQEQEPNSRVDSGGQGKELAREIGPLVWMGYGVDVRGYGVDVRGYGVDVRGYCVDVRGYGVDVRGYGVDVRGYGVDVRGYGVDASFTQYDLVLRVLLCQ